MRLGRIGAATAWLGAVGVLVLAACSPLAVAPADSRPSDSLPSARLPTDMVPKHYELRIDPDLDARTFSGDETIDIDVRRPTKRLTLNAAELAIASASLEGGPAARVTLVPAKQQVVIEFPEPLSVGSHRLQLAFHGVIHPYGRGLFYEDYAEGTSRRRLIATQFEPADARRLFPSWDQPAFKATFALSVTVPERFLAVSNMPVEREEHLGEGRKQVTFARTPPMSTYLLVMVAGELERLERDHGGVKLGVVTTRGKREQGRSALDNAERLLDYYDDYFGVRYPLPKLDLIALPGGMNGAMENWGGITFSEDLLLYEQGRTPPGERRTQFSVLAHEMAHLWFGDLVTMDWWDDLWLNEGFASWMEVKASEHFHPEWRPWTQRGGSKQRAMHADSRRTAHPVEHSISDESEALTAFDEITYTKGQSLLRMIEAWLGEGPFREGLRSYVASHAYGSATTADLWRSLEASSGQPVEAVAGPFTRQPGVPLVQVRSNCEAAAPGASRVLSLEQQRYSLHYPEAPPLHWRVPMRLRLIDEGRVEAVLLDGTQQVALGRCGQAVLADDGDIGYYRVHYGDRVWNALVSRSARLTTAERASLAANAWAFAENGSEGPERFLGLVQGLPADAGRAEWEQAMRVLNQLDLLEQIQPGRAALRRFAIERLRVPFQRLGWEPRKDEDEDERLLRPQLIRELGLLGDPEVIAEARRRFERFVADPATLRPSLRATVTNIVGRHCDPATCEELLSLARKAVRTEDRRRLYTALARSADPAVARRTLDLVLSTELAPGLASQLLFIVSGAGEHAALAWDFARENWPALEARLGPSFVNSAPFLIANLPRSDLAKQTLESFAPLETTAASRRQKQRALELVEVNEALSARLVPRVADWLKARGAG